MRARWGRLSVARQVLVLLLTLVTLLVAGGFAVAVVEARHGSEQSARERVLAVAETFAQAPGVADAVSSADPSTRLQPRAEATRLVTGVDFVVVMSTSGVRYTHPDPSRIGGQFLGHLRPAVAGHAFTETFTGTLGPSVRAVVPVRDDGGRVIGLVAVGITAERISGVLRHQLPALLGLAAAALLLAVLGASYVSRRLRRQTLGLGPVEITRLYEHHDAVLHAVREGLLVLDRNRRVLLANDQAVRLLALPAEAQGMPAAELGVTGSLGEVLTGGREASDELHVAGDRLLAVNQKPARRGHQLLGTVTTLRDHTELQALTGELDSVRSFAEALRASAHEAANRLHTVVTLVELGRDEEAIRFATDQLEASQELADRLLSRVGEPVLAALLLGKVAQAHERGVELLVDGDAAAKDVALAATDLVTVVGNLVDNAIDAAAAAAPARVEVTVRCDNGELLIRVADTGHGIASAAVGDIFEKGWSTKSTEQLHGRGLGLTLVRQVVQRLSGTIEITHDSGAVFTVRIPLPAPALP